MLCGFVSALAYTRVVSLHLAKEVEWVSLDISKCEDFTSKCSGCGIVVVGCSVL